MTSLELSDVTCMLFIQLQQQAVLRQTTQHNTSFSVFRKILF
jgi:hypothetical protein